MFASETPKLTCMECSITYIYMNDIIGFSSDRIRMLSNSYLSTSI